MAEKVIIPPWDIPGEPQFPNELVSSMSVSYVHLPSDRAHRIANLSEKDMAFISLCKMCHEIDNDPRHITDIRNTCEMSLGRGGYNRDKMNEVYTGKIIHQPTAVGYPGYDPNAQTGGKGNGVGAKIKRGLQRGNNVKIER